MWTTKPSRSAGCRRRPALGAGVRLRRTGGVLALTAAAGLAIGGCGVSAATAGGSGAGGRVIHVVAAENFWGSIAQQVGGDHVKVTSIIANPNADPHSYEPTPQDARTLATAQYVIYNGIGYDPWSGKLLAANPGDHAVLEIGQLLGVAAGGNPHRWYNPADVRRVIDQVVADYKRLDPTDSSYFDIQKTRFTTVALKQYDGLIADIRAKYAGAPVGASESIFSMLAPALGLDLITPPTFLRAISEGTDVSAGDKATIDAQITNKRLRVYIYNSQNTTPDVQAQLTQCRAEHIPTATITETLVPPTATYQDWQSRQLRGIEAALAVATGK